MLRFLQAHNLYERRSKMTQSVLVLGAHTVTLPVILWRTETRALQPRKSPIHLSNSSSQPRF